MSPRTTSFKPRKRDKGHEPELSPQIAAELAELEAALRGEPGAGDELSALVREVRAAAPQLGGDVSEQLDARVAEQFARPKGSADRARGRAAGAGGDGQAQRRPLARAPRSLAGGFGGWRRGGAGGGSLAFGGVAGVLAVTLLAFVGVGGALVTMQGSDDVDSSVSQDSIEYAKDSGGTAAPVQELSAPFDESSSAAEDVSESTDTDAAGSSAQRAPTEQVESAASGASPASSSGVGAASAAAPGAGGSSQRAVRRSVDMTVTVEELDQAATRVGEITGGAGGFVSTSEVNLREGDTGSGSFTLRIPTAKLDATLRELGELGIVTEQNRSAQDITSQLDSAEAKLTDAKQERSALLRALAKANSSGEIASLRARIADNRREQARLDAAVRRVQRQTTTSTVQLTLTTYRDGGTFAPDREGLRGALDDAVAILEGIAGFLIVAAAVIAPFALLGAAATWAITRRRRARHRRALGDD